MMWLQSMYARVADALRREEGQGLVEYALILSLVSIASIAFLTLVGIDVGEVLTTVETRLTAQADR